MINRLFEKTHIPMIDQHWKMMWTLKYKKSYKKFTRDLQEMEVKNGR